MQQRHAGSRPGSARHGGSWPATSSERCRRCSTPRSEVTVDLGALRRNVARLLAVLQGSQLWAVVKADAYGHGAEDVSRAALEAGASALCVATVGEGLTLRRALADARILVLGPAGDSEVRAAREAGLELAISRGPVPEGLPLHLKVDTGMGRYGFPLLPPVGPDAVGLMSHLATADSDLAFARRQVEGFRALAAAHPGLEAHVANSAAALRLPEARLSAARCGIALYGLSPFGSDPTDDGLEPVLSWRSELAQVKPLEPGQSAGYGRRFVADRPTWIGLIPVGYADGFRRDLTGTEVLVDGERCRVAGTVSMDSCAVELPRELPVGTPVTLIGDGLLAEQHARVADTINYEIVCGIRTSRERSERHVVGA
ncbi:MAG: alanine racemase [Candidatus Rokuibacteriota bacterium]|nr:MAG: alanine racemase [Candidatus Rokubacteria bacterium]